MNRIILTIIVVIAWTYSGAQVLEKGNVEIHLGLGLGIYSLTSNDYGDNSGAGVPGLIPIGLAYQINEKFGIGLDYERNGFATDPDSNNKAVSTNLGLELSYNFINGEKSVLNSFFILGVSSFRYDDFRSEEYVIGTGPKMELGGSYKHFIAGRKIGYFINLSIPYYLYNEFKNKDGDILKVSKQEVVGTKIINHERVYEISMTGVNFRFGLLLRL